MSAQKALSPVAVAAANVSTRITAAGYPEPFFSRLSKRIKRPLGDLFGLTAFGVNQTTLAPGGESGLLHAHTRQDELIYILSGQPTLITDEAEMILRPGMCAGFAANGRAHQLVNRTTADVVYLEIGDRTPGDEVIYPNDDLQTVPGPDGACSFTHKDGRAY